MTKRNSVFRLLLAFSNAILGQSYLAGNSDLAVQSRLANIECDLLLTVGRLPSTTMPQKWAASGAKLGLPLKVKFTKEVCEYDMNKEKLLGTEFPPFLSVDPLSEPSFVSANGVEKVKVTRGAYALQAHDPETQQYSFRFFLDFPEGATRNDVILPSERIYFMTSCWNDDDHILGRAEKWKDDILTSIQKIDKDIAKMNCAKSSKGLIQMTTEFKKKSELLELRAKYVSQVEMLDDKFPLQPGKVCSGPNNTKFLKEGVIAVKRKGGNNKDRYDWVGTFEFKKISVVGE